ncbi:response regulator [Mucilaginibacter sp. JRF]|uniref:response regulator n=1 Tax=Mucilaginibacter sp. JRF TaxID=2780088 RepID=UPI0018821CB5|nr:response regulator [Mucilaginibacter sp. JRF]MBE9585851.1 response regulator [Mucilaginibacter sp. JRF]
MYITLMIDDNPVEHLIMQKMFDHYEVFQNTSHSSNGADIIAWMKENCEDEDNLPDLIFLDLNMPFSGWQFLTELSEIKDVLCKQPVIYILSSSIDRDEQSRAQKYPFVKGFMSKPVSKQQLYDIAEQNIAS